MAHLGKLSEPVAVARRARLVLSTWEGFAFPPPAAHGAMAMRDAVEGDDPLLAFARFAIPHDNSKGLPVRWSFRWRAGIEVSRSENAPWVPLPPELRYVADELRMAGMPDSPLGLVLNVGRVFERIHSPPP